MNIFTRIGMAIAISLLLTLLVFALLTFIPERFLEKHKATIFKLFVAFIRVLFILMVLATVLMMIGGIN